MSTEPGLHELGAAVRRHLPSAECVVVVFGSCATGRAHDRSSWDIGLLAEASIRGAVLQAVREELEGLRTLDSFDVVDRSTMPAPLHEAVLRTASGSA